MFPVSLLLNLLGKLTSSRRPSLTAFLALGFTGIGHLVFVSAVGIARTIFNFVLLVVPLRSLLTAVRTARRLYTRAMLSLRQHHAGVRRVRGRSAARRTVR